MTPAKPQIYFCLKKYYIQAGFESDGNAVYVLFIQWERRSGIN